MTTDSNLSDNNIDDIKKIFVNGGFENSLKMKRSHTSVENSSNDDIQIQEIENSVEENGKNYNKSDEESFLRILSQVFLPFFIAGFGMVSAGLLLDIAQHWPVFENVTQIFIMVPALLGLKGNLEMTLASRLSTLSNLGKMDGSSKWECQAIVVALLASIAAVVLNWIYNGLINFQDLFLLSSSALMTASSASLILGLIMALVVVVARYFNINPDNIATPIAASLGDLITLSILMGVSTVLYSLLNSYPWICPVIIIFYIASIPLWVFFSLHSKITETVIKNGWQPIIFAMIISSLGGFILDLTVVSFKGFAVFQPVINGVGGNLVAIQASRLSTSLHKESTLGVLLPHRKIFENPYPDTQTCQVLLSVLIPGHVTFLLIIQLLKAGHIPFTFAFMFAFLIAAICQVLVLLCVCHIMVLYMWKNAIDPDNSAIPYLTALGDLFGTGFLAVTFYVLFSAAPIVKLIQDTD